MQNDGGVTGTWNGVCKSYAIYVTDSSSSNPSDWGAPVATGTWTWPNLQERKEVTFMAKTGRYVYFARLSAYGWFTEQGYPGYAGANEIWVYEQGGGGGGGSAGDAYYHADGNGNITCMIDANQAIVANYKYDPYGRTISSSGGLATVNVYRFSSKEIHPSSGMYYYLYRFYDPNTQRWLNRDPLGDDGSLVYAVAKIEPRIERRSEGELAAMVEAVRDPLSIFTQVNLNLYGADGNNPVSNFDAYGLDFASCYADCIEHYRDPLGNGIGYICNAGLNKLVGPTGRTGIGGAGSHPTTWQHKLGSKFGSVGSKIGKAAGRAAIVLTIADGFFDLGLLGGCAAACAGE